MAHFDLAQSYSASPSRPVTEAFPQPERVVTKDLASRRRVVLAKIGLDGHDRGIQVVARGLRDRGFHVVHAGIWQTPEAVAQAVGDEDAQWLGVSLLSGAHMTVLPRIMEALHRRRLGDVSVAVGGIIPEQHIPALREMGVDGVFGPGTSIDAVAEFLHGGRRREGIAEELIEGCRRQDRRSLSRLLTLIADGVLPSHPGLARAGGTRASRVALTGSAGVGKSSLLARLMKEARQRGLATAVLACDPESPLSGGALLGDRVRMSDTQPDPGIFIRSLAVPSGSQGIAVHLDQMVAALELFGFELVLIETAGVGQGDIAVRGAADSVVLLMQPESGDSVQWDKAGLLEVADVVVIHKSDLPGAGQMASELWSHLNSAGGRSVSVTRASSVANVGIRELWEMIHK
jgi:LAO/AO transport system ATPase